MNDSYIHIPYCNYSIYLCWISQYMQDVKKAHTQIYTDAHTAALRKMCIFNYLSSNADGLV